MGDQLREAAQRRIRALLDLGRTRAALAEVTRCLARDPGDPGLLELLGLCRIRLGEPREAQGALREAIAAAPERPHLHYLLGFAARDDLEVESAEAGFREAVRLSPDEPVYLRALAELLADARRPDEALPLARRAVEVDADAASNHVTLGYVASAAGRIDLAREEYRAAVALDPQNAVAWNNLGCIEMAEGDRLSARERFHEALRLDPGGERARRNLGLVSPPSRPSRMYDDFEFFLGEALRELRAAGRLGPPARLMALALAVGGAAIRSAITGRDEEAGPASRIGVATGTIVAGAALRRLGPLSILPIGIGAAVAGVGWLATARRATPLRHRYVELVAAARKEWQETRAAWLDHRLSRDARDRAMDRTLERLCVAIDREPPAGAPSADPTAATDGD